jgi:hypothetical protein
MSSVIEDFNFIARRASEIRAARYHELGVSPPTSAPQAQPPTQEAAPARKCCDGFKYAPGFGHLAGASSPQIGNGRKCRHRGRRIARSKRGSNAGDDFACNTPPQANRLRSIPSEPTVHCHVCPGPGYCVQYASVRFRAEGPSDPVRTALIWINAERRCYGTLDAMQRALAGLPAAA